MKNIKNILFVSLIFINSSYLMANEKSEKIKKDSWIDLACYDGTSEVVCNLQLLRGDGKVDNPPIRKPIPSSCISTEEWGINAVKVDRDCVERFEPDIWWAKKWYIK
jgi:hypothetical protein